MNWSTILEKVSDVTGLTPNFQVKVLQSFAIVLLCVLIRFLLRRVVWRHSQDVRIRYRWLKTSTYAITFVGFLLVGRIWFQGIQSLATYLGIVSAGLAIALQDIVSNFAGWIFILWRRPFSIGDRVQVGEHTGDVIDIRIFQFTLLEVGNWVDADQSTGRVIHVPNRDVLSKVTANFATGFQYIWDELPVLITFESNWEKAKAILKKIVKRHGEKLTKGAEQQIREASRRYMIFYNVLTPAVYTDVRDSGVLLTLRYLSAPRGRRSVKEEIWEEILQEFGKCSDIDFAYPTQRFYNNVVEGKDSTKPVTKQTASLS